MNVLDQFRVSELLLRHVAQNYTPKRMQGSDHDALLRFQRPAMEELSDLFTSDRGDRRRDYLNHPPYRAAYLLLYFLPNFLKAGLLTLTTATRPTSDARILDIGAGPASASLGMAAGLRLLNPTLRSVEIIALDRSRSILRDAEELAARFSEQWGIAIRLRARDGDLRTLIRKLPDHPVDHVVVANTVNELLERKRGQLEPVELLDLLARLPQAARSSVWIIEPAQLPSARFIQALRDIIARENLGRILAPCVHSRDCCFNTPGNKNWCHTVWPWTPPGWYAAAQQALGHFSGALRLSYVVFSLAKQQNTARAAKSFYRIVSQPMTDNNGPVLLLCGNGRCWRLRPGQHPAMWNALKQTCHRGQLIRLSDTENSSEGIRLTRRTRLISAAPLEL